MSNVLRACIAICSIALLTDSNGQDAYLQDLSIGRYIRTATDHPITVSIRNTTNDPISQYRIGWRWNNGQVHHSPDQRIAGAGIVANSMFSFTHPVPLKVRGEGAGQLKVWVDVQGERDRRNDTLTLNVKAIDRAVPKTVLLEMKTSSGCSYCPKANELTNQLDRDPRVVVAKYHTGDELAVRSAVEYFKKYTTEDITPAGVIDQGEHGSYEANTQYSQWQAQIEARKGGVAPVIVRAKPNYDPRTRELCMEMWTTFTYPEPGEYVINAVLLEDDVKGSQTSAEQNYVHHQVVRHVLGGTHGVSDVIPEKPVAGTAYAYTFSVTVPQEWNAENMRVITYVTRRENGGDLTLNATKGRLLPQRTRTSR